MKTRIPLLFLCFILLLAGLFLADLVWGSYRISLSDVWAVLTGDRSNAIQNEIILNFRLPKALAAILAGASLSVAGLLMQTLFRNSLADPSILGISAGAGLGVALVMMASFLLPVALINSGWAVVLAAIAGAMVVLTLVVGISFRISSAVSLLIVGMMIGTIASSVVSVIQNFSSPDTVKLFLTWTFGSLTAVTWNYMQVLVPVLFGGFFLAFMLQKRLDGLLLGENYARALGISITTTRFLIVLATGLLAGGITAFTGPIAFVGVAIPHLARGLFRSSTHRVLLPACICIGASLLLLCDMISQLPTYTLPINTISALFGAPVILWILIKRR